MVVKKINIKIAKTLAKILNVNLKVIPLEEWMGAIIVEMEHGTKHGKNLDVTHDDLILTAKIALAHLMEYPDYYRRLRKMEEEAEKYWSKRQKPDILLK